MLPKTEHFLSLRQKSKIFATSLVRGRHPLRKPFAVIPTVYFRKPLHGGLKADAPYGHGRKPVPLNGRFGIAHGEMNLRADQSIPKENLPLSGKSTVSGFAMA